MANSRNSKAPPTVREASPGGWQSVSRATIRMLKRAAQDRQGGVRSSGIAVFKVRAHPDTLERVTTFLGELSAASKARGLRLVQMRDGVGLEVDGEPVIFELYQVIKRTRHLVTPFEEARLERWTRRYGQTFDIEAWRRRPEIPLWDFSPTGELKIDIGGWPRPAGPTHVFADSKRKRIEERIPEMMDTFAAHAEFQKTRRAEEDVRRQNFEHRRHELERTGFEAGLERARVAYMEGKLGSFRKHEDLRALLQMVTTAAGHVTAAAFVSWAEDHLADLASALTAATIEQETSGLRAFSRLTEPPGGV